MRPSSSVVDFVRSLDLDAWEVGGAVRDELLGKPHKDTDFVVPGVGHEELRTALEPHGRVEDLVVAGRRVGVRLHPRDRSLAPAGIEFAPPRTERSTGPGRHDFEIVADASIPLEEDMRRRDFTINAIARRLATGEILDPLGGRDDLERRLLRTTTPASFREDPLRIVRGLRFVSQLDLEPDEATLAQMREHADAVGHVSAERIGGGLAADGMGELSKLLLGPHPARALRLAVETGVLAHVLPELGAAPTAERLAAVEAAAPVLAVRLALLLDGLEPERTGAALDRLRYPTRLRERVVRIARGRGFALPERPAALDARRFLARHGAGLAGDLLAHREATLRAAGAGLEPLAAFARLVEAEEASPHRLADLAVSGADLLALGYPAGPALGEALRTLLDEVVEDPARNERETLLARARELL